MRAIPFLFTMPKNVNQPPPFAGVILDPHETFQRIRRKAPLRRALIVYLILTILLFSMLLLPPWEEYTYSSSMSLDLIHFFGATAWVALFYRISLVFLFFSVEFDPDSTVDALTYGDILWGTISYLGLATILAYVGYVSAVHLAIGKLSDAKGHLKNIITSFLYIVNAATLFFFVPFAILIIGGTVLENTYLYDIRYNGLTEPTMANFIDMFEGVLVFLAVTAFLGLFSVVGWSATVHVLAIRQTYRLSWPSSLRAWFLSVILFVPVTVAILLAEAANEISRPFRIRIQRRRLERLSQQIMDAVGAEDQANALRYTKEYMQIYTQSTEVARRARLHIDLNTPLTGLYQLLPEAALRHLIDLAQQEPYIQLQASRALKAMLDAAPDQTIKSCYFLLFNSSPPELFQNLGHLREQTPPLDFGKFIYRMLKVVDADNLTVELGNAEKTLTAWRERPHGDELYLVYRTLNELSKALTVVDLERIEDDLVKALNVQNPLLAETNQIFKSLLDISQYLNYYGRSDFENKVPYLAAPIMILVNEDRQLQEKHFPPEDRLLRLLIPKLQDIILREFDGLRGRADLHFELKPQRIPFTDNVSVVLYVRNQGNAVAEQMHVLLENSSSNGFAAGDKVETLVNLLSPKREARLEFQIQPHEPGKIRLPFQIRYDDLERKGRQIPYASLIDLYDADYESAQSAPDETFVNPYIKGLPVKEPAMFFGREEVFRFIREHLQGQYEKNIIVLSGQRRTGKTSILYQLEHRLDEKFIPIVLDLQGFTSSGVDLFLHWVAYNIRRVVVKRGYRIKRPREEKFQTDPYGYFQREFLPMVWDAIDYHHLLLVFDEFEEMATRVEDGKVDKDIFPYLRHLMQHTERLDFIFAGTYKLREITQEYWSILFNISLFRDIGFMNPEEVDQIIREPVKGIIFYDDLAIEKITRITAGHPYFVQLLGSKLVDHYIKHGNFYLTLQDVNQVLSDTITAGTYHFDYLWDQSTATEKILLTAMARTIPREGGTASLGDIMRLFDRFDLDVDRASVLAAVQSLTTRELLLADADLRQFEFKFDLLRLWLDQYKPFGTQVESYRTEPEIEIRTES